MRHIKQLYASGIILLVVIFGLAACGESEKSVVPVVENPFEGATIGTDSTLEVATWNLENFAKKDEETVIAVIQAVEAMDVDIIALQEIKEFTYFRQVREGLSGWEGIQATSDRYINLAFLYRVDGDLQVDSVYEILVEYSREFPRRPFVFEGRFNSVPIVVINNHYKCCGDGTIEETDWDEETRRRDASLLLDEFIRANYADQRVFVVGDLNDILTDVPTRNVFQNFLDAPDFYRFVDMAIAEGPGTGWSYPSWPSHLDHILITAPLFEAASGSDAEVMVVPLYMFLRNGLTDYDLLLSDHLPVVVKLKL